MNGSFRFRFNILEKERIREGRNIQKVESYLTYLDYTTLEHKRADVQSKVGEIEMENQMLRQRDSENKDICQIRLCNL